VLPHAFGDLLACGLSSLDALRSLTATAARVCGVEHRAGRLQPGFDADVVAVDGDPTSDPAALTRVVGVWKAGRRAA
jgi:imidazolonepropionase-like amidohydrolase